MSGMQLVHTSYFKAQSLPFFADFSLQPQRALSLLQLQGTTLNVFVAAVETMEQLAVKGNQRTERKKLTFLPLRGGMWWIVPCLCA
jgi:hypothetical protein